MSLGIYEVDRIPILRIKPLNPKRTTSEKLINRATAGLPFGIRDPYAALFISHPPPPPPPSPPPSSSVFIAKS